MAALRCFLGPIVLAAVASACGSSTSHRSVTVDAGVDSGPDGGSTPTKPDGSTTRDSGSPGKDAGVDASSGIDARPTADATSDGTAATDAGSSVDSGVPVLGEFCTFTDANLESYVRSAL